MFSIEENEYYHGKHLRMKYQRQLKLHKHIHYINIHRNDGFFGNAVLLRYTAVIAQTPLESIP